MATFRVATITIGRDSALTYALAGAFCLSAPLIRFLVANEYPLLAREVVPLYIVILSCGLGVGLLAGLGMKRLANFSLWALIFLGIAFLYAVDTTTRVALLAIATGVVVLFFKRNAAMVIVTVAIAHIASTLALRYTDAKAAVRPVSELKKSLDHIAPINLPPVVHLVLDELAGPRGMPSELSETAGLVSGLTDQFIDLGFDLYTHAYSEYYLTTGSLPNLVNFSSSAINGVYISGSGDKYKLESNKYFEHLLRLGYDLKVYQSSYLSYCDIPSMKVSSCVTYPVNSIGSILGVPIDDEEKTRFIFNSFLDSSAFIRLLRQAYLMTEKKIGIALPAWPSGNSRTGPLALTHTIEKLKSDMRSLRPGEAYFAHLMMPHYPYVFTSTCGVKPRIVTWLNIVPFEGTQNDNSSRAMRYRQYYDQVECARKIVGDLLSAVRESGQFDRAVIIVHGDHGSRIVRTVPRTTSTHQLVDDDFRDSYSAFFAVKTPASAGLVYSLPASLQRLLARVWEIPMASSNEERVYLMPAGKDALQAVPLRGFESISIPGTPTRR